MDLARFLAILAEKKVSADVAYECLKFVNLDIRENVDVCKAWYAATYPDSRWWRLDRASCFELFDQCIDETNRVMIVRDQHNSPSIVKVIIADSQNRLLQAVELIDLRYRLVMLPILARHLSPESMAFVKSSLNAYLWLPHDVVSCDIVNHMSSHYELYKPYLYELATGESADIWRPLWIEVAFYSNFNADLEEFADCVTADMGLVMSHQTWASLEEDMNGLYQSPAFKKSPA